MMAARLANTGFAAMLFALAASAQAAWAQGGADFYRGKQITMLVASGAGGGYDVYARTFARHASRHLPGSPVVVARNMPAGGGLQAALTLYNVSDKDGLTIGALTNGVALDPLFGHPGANYDGRKFGWIGSIGKLQNICATWHTSPVKTIADARAREVVVAGAGATSNSAIMPRIANELLGTRFRIITGYDPNAGLNKAMEGGEAEGICGLSWSTLKASRPDWIRDSRLNVLVQFGMEKLPDLPNVPAALDLVTDESRRKVLELILIRQEVGRPFATPPAIPADRLAILRAAFDATMQDSEFRAEAAKLNLEIEPLTGARIDAFMHDAYATPKQLVEQAASLVMPPGSR